MTPSTDLTTAGRPTLLCGRAAKGVGFRSSVGAFRSGHLKAFLDPNPVVKFLRGIYCKRGVSNPPQEQRSTPT